MKENGYLINTERGFPVGLRCFTDTLHFDATNPEARSYVWNKVKQNYYDKGIKVFWLDEAEREYSFYDFDHYRYHLGAQCTDRKYLPQMLCPDLLRGYGGRRVSRTL